LVENDNNWFVCDKIRSIPTRTEVKRSNLQAVRPSLRQIANACRQCNNRSPNRMSLVIEVHMASTSRTHIGRLEQVLHETTESRQVGGDGRNSHDGTFSWSVTPWLIYKQTGAQEYQIISRSLAISVCTNSNWGRLPNDILEQTLHSPYPR
jgi:hypothetical protein